MEIKQKTEKETLIEIFNDEQRLFIYDQVNIAFYQEKAKVFKKGSIENKQAMKEMKEIETSSFYRKIILRVIRSMIDEEK